MHNLYGLILTGIFKMNGKKESYSPQRPDNLFFVRALCVSSAAISSFNNFLFLYSRLNHLFYDHNHVLFEEMT